LLSNSLFYGGKGLHLASIDTGHNMRGRPLVRDSRSGLSVHDG